MGGNRNHEFWSTSPVRNKILRAINAFVINSDGITISKLFGKVASDIDIDESVFANAFLSDTPKAPSPVCIAYLVHEINLPLTKRDWFYVYKSAYDYINDTWRHHGDVLGELAESARLAEYKSLNAMVDSYKADLPHLSIFNGTAPLIETIERIKRFNKFIREMMETKNENPEPAEPKAEAASDPQPDMYVEPECEAEETITAEPLTTNHLPVMQYAIRRKLQDVALRVRIYSESELANLFEALDKF